MHTLSLKDDAEFAASPGWNAAVSGSAMDRAIAELEDWGRAKAAAKLRIDTDPRIIARRAAKAALTTHDSGPGLFLELIDGTMQKRAVLSRLIQCRIALVEGFPQRARLILRDVAQVRRQSYAVKSADDGMVIVGAVA